jgi:hypothetical protein
MRITLTVLMICILTSCVKRESKQTNFTPNKSIIELNRMVNWLDFYNLKLENFTDTLSLTERQSISFDYDFKTDSTSLFRDFLIYSPDSNYCIDLDSYSLMLEKDSDGKLFSEGVEVDTEVALLDIGQNKRFRVMFCGTESTPEEAQWINKDSFYILGYTKENNLIHPTIWIHDNKNNTIREIQSESPIDLNGKNYIHEERLKTIRFKE